MILIIILLKTDFVFQEVWRYGDPLIVGIKSNFEL